MKPTDQEMLEGPLGMNSDDSEPEIVKSRHSSATGFSEEQIREHEERSRRLVEAMVRNLNRNVMEQDDAARPTEPTPQPPQQTPTDPQK